MPAFVNISVGSPFTTIGAEGTTEWPRERKNSRNVSRIAFEVICV